MPFSHRPRTDLANHLAFHLNHAYVVRLLLSSFETLQQQEVLAQDNVPVPYLLANRMSLLALLVSVLSDPGARPTSFIDPSTQGGTTSQLNLMYLNKIHFGSVLEEYGGEELNEVNYLSVL